MHTCTQAYECAQHLSGTLFRKGSILGGKLSLGKLPPFPALSSARSPLPCWGHLPSSLNHRQVSFMSLRVLLEPERSHTRRCQCLISTEGHGYCHTAFQLCHLTKHHQVTVFRIKVVNTLRYLTHQAVIYCTYYTI